MYTLKPIHVKRVAKGLADHLGARIVRKDRAVEMQLVRAFLELCHIPAADDFLERYSTVLVPPVLVTRPTVYLPYVAGATGAGAPSLVEQFANIGHEFHHVLQWRADPALFAVRYAADLSKRAQCEAEALEVTMELTHWCTGAVPNYRALADGLRAYGLRSADIRAVRAHLRSKALAVALGGINKQVSQRAIAMLPVAGKA